MALHPNQDQGLYKLFDLQLCWQLVEGDDIRVMQCSALGIV